MSQSIDSTATQASKTTRDVSVPPELTDRSLEIAVKRLANDLRYGQDPSPFVSSGVDYVQSRPFVDGDSVRDIDWRVTARSGRHYVKEYESLKTTPVFIVFDTSASMVFSSRPTSKYQLGLILAGGIALASLRRLSPVGLLASSQHSQYFPLSSSRQRVFGWLAQLRVPRRDSRTELADRLSELQASMPTRSLVIVISDLHDTDSVAAIKRTHLRHDVAVVQLQDPAERGNLRGGVFRGSEAETNTGFIARSRSKWFTQATPQTQLAESGIDHLLLSTDQSFLAPLRRFLSARDTAAQGLR